MTISRGAASKEMKADEHDAMTLSNDRTKESEAPLVEGLKRGDREAFREVVRRYSARILRQACLLLGSEEAAEDASQDVFIKAFQNMQTIRGTTIGGWLARITYHHCIDLLRRRKAQPKTVSLPDEDVLLAPSQPFPAGEWEFLNTLSAQEHYLINLRFAENLDYQEISEITGLASGSLRNLFLKTMKKLRDEVAKHGL